MALIYITGPSAVGKSTICNELIKLGYEAHDTDEAGMSAWRNIQTMEIVEVPDERDRPNDWYKNHEFRIEAERVKALVEKAKDKTIFLCGLPANDLEFTKYFDKIFCLTIDEKTLTQRLHDRDTNDFGKSPDELKLILYWYEKIVKRYENLSATMIDATKPLDVIVNEIITFKA